MVTGVQEVGASAEGLEPPAADQVVGQLPGEPWGDPCALTDPVQCHDLEAFGLQGEDHPGLRLRRDRASTALGVLQLHHRYGMRAQ